MKKSRKKLRNSMMGLLMSVILMATMLPMPAFAESGVEQIKQQLKELNQKLGQTDSNNGFVVSGNDPTVFVQSKGTKVNLGTEIVKLTIPEGITVQWGAKTEGTGSEYLIELAAASEGTFELMPDVPLTNPNGEGILVQGGTLAIKENVNITMESTKEESAVIRATGGKVDMTGGEITASMKNGFGISLENNAEMMMSGGKVTAGALGSVDSDYGIRLAGGSTLTLTNTASISTSNNAGAACKVEGGILTLEKGTIDTSTISDAPALEVTGGKAVIKGGNLVSRSSKDTSNAVSLSGGVIEIDGGTIRSEKGKAISASGSTANVYISGGSIKGDVTGLDSARLKNSASGEAVYRVTLTNLLNERVTLSSPKNYGIQDVTVDNEGKLYFYVPAGETKFKLKLGETPYEEKYTVQANHSNTLTMQANTTIPGEITISEQPEERTITYGEAVTLSVASTSENNNPITYQWYSATNASGDGPQALPNETNPILTISKPNAGTYYYYCVLNATNCEEKKSDVVTVNIEKRPVKIKVNNFSINVGNPPPSEYTYVIEGQLDGEYAFNQSADEIKGKVTCDADGKIRGEFPITVDMSGLTYTDNYKAGDPASQNGTLTVREVPSPSPAPRPRYRLSVDPQSEWDFGQTLLNGPVHGKEFVVKNTGNRTLGQLSVSLSGEQAEHFELTKKELGPLSVHRTQSFTVMPKSGLPVGAYRATLRIQGDHGIDKQVKLRFEVVGSPLDGHRVWEKKTEVSPDKEWTIRFNQAIDKESATKENVYLVSQEQPMMKISATIRLSEDATKLYIQPEKPLSSKGSYFLVIQSLKAANGKLLKENVVMPFETK